MRVDEGEKHQGLEPVPGDAVDAALVERCELLKRGGGEVKVPRRAANAAVDGHDINGLALV